MISGTREASGICCPTGIDLTPQSAACRRGPDTTVRMKRVALVLALMTCSMCAQEWARQKLEKSPRHREWVTVKHDNRSVETFVAYPESKNKTPIVLVIHEIFGLSDWVQDLTDQ